jgi:hypothetical protein
MSRARDLADGTFSGAFSADSPTLVVDAANNRVGVGTASPSTILTLDSGGTPTTLKIDSLTESSIDFDDKGGSAKRYKIGTNISSNDGQFEFKDMTANAERMRIDSSGRVGIGATPAASFTGHNVLQTGSQSVLGANASLSTTGQTYLTHNLYFDTAGNYQVFNTGSANEGSIYAQADGAHKWSSSAATTGTPTVVERMRLTYGGDLLIGKTANDWTQTGFQYEANNPHIGVTKTQSDNNVFLRKNNATGTLVQFWYNSTGIGSITMSSSSVSYNTSSDYRLKENVTDLTGAIDRVKQVPVHRFNFIADPDKTVDGFLAHEVQTIVPEAVTGEKDAMRTEEYEVTPAVYEDVIIPAVLDDEGNEVEAERTEQRLVTEAVMGTREVPEYQGIDQSKLVPLLTAAIKEQQALIEDLQTRLAALEAV